MRSRKFLKAEQAALVWDAPGLVAGVDEAGRGPLAGPVVAAAVILDDLRPIRGLADSKTLTALQRERLHDQILAKALCCSVGQASVEEIDTHNILQATMLAMRRAVEGLRLKPAKVLVDGNRLPTLDVLAEAIIKGDARVKAISAASILAKVHRDRLCEQLHVEFPHYGFAGHKGYGTPEHLEALQRHGACVHHRRSFSPVAAALARTAAADAVALADATMPVPMRIATVETAHLDPGAAPRAPA
ncbi:ribonuclease HII [Variovorax paradoxus]|uniref:ribonuclease HII n=1 Tax=Variovorax paradoxus TaxID=34073 RepID=UPI00278706FC|nr:ribonuclease HII [Variovorax paradoxus]MDQ0590880.1 ribonuclease HII [Variovorax paradoxus]